jgi:hypothetical protein
MGARASAGARKSQRRGTMKRIAMAVLAGTALIALSGCASSDYYYGYERYSYDPYLDDSYARDRAYYLRQSPGYYDQFGVFHPY